MSGVMPFDTMQEAYDMVNDSRYGLNTGILTNNIAVAMEATRVLQSGSVIVGGTCGFRIGNMPYGGVKDSGFGKEGPRYAIEKMSQTKTVVILN
ncbi:MAG: aldehyde dehydrogenase family protein [Oscillospiraceae bacterium]